MTGLERSLFASAQIVLAVTFLYAGSAKLFVPKPLGKAIWTVSGVGPSRRRTADRIARAVGVVEVVTAFLLVNSFGVVAGLVGAAALGSGIALFAGVALTRGAEVACGCFGESRDRRLGLGHLLFGVVVAVVAAAMLTRVPQVGLTETPGPLASASLLALALVIARNRIVLLRPLRRHFQPFTRTE
jgi:hypothetical protein